MSASSSPAAATPARPGWWHALHWGVAVSPFALVLALSVWGYERYAWIPLVAAVLCPLGAVLTGLQLKRDRRRAEQGR